MPSPNPIARLPDETESGGGLPPTAVARLIWDGERLWTATALLDMHLRGQAADDGAARRSVIDEARVWLC